MRRTILALAITGLAFAASAGPPGSAPVTVINTTANPVPVREVAPKLAQFDFVCAQREVGEASCYANFSDKITLPPNQRFVIQYLNVHIRSQEDAAALRDFQWFIGYGTWGTNFTTTALKRDYTNTQTFIGNQNVLLYVDEFFAGGNLPQFGCLADRRNEAGETFSCNFVASGYFAPKP